MIRVQERDFDIGAEIGAIRSGRSDIGAIVTFTGLVRERAVAGPGGTVVVLDNVHPAFASAVAARRSSEPGTSSIA